MGWAEDQAKQIADAEAAMQKSREWQLHEAARIKTEAPAFFEKLVNQIQTYVDEFNAAREATGVAGVRCDRASGRIAIIKESARPAMSVQVQFSQSPVSVGIYRRTVDVGQEPRDSSTTMTFSVDPNGNLRLNGNMDVEPIAQLVLGEVFRSFRPQL